MDRQPARDMYPTAHLDNGTPAASRNPVKVVTLTANGKPARKRTADRLSHLAWAIADITRSRPTAAWLLAVAVDLSIVLAESVSVFAPDAGVSWLACIVLIAVTACSMLLNVWAFLRHR